MAIRRRAVIAHHIILSGYGFWLANDPRGSGSEEVREKKFLELGEVHCGRKREQPTRGELREFYAKASGKLEHAPVWFGEEMRGVIGEEFGRVVERGGYTVWECFVGANHAHVCVRRHRDKYEAICLNLMGQVREAFLGRGWIGVGHPLWADRPYSVFCYTAADVRRTVNYIGENAAKEGLARQRWGFVKAYDGWPFGGR